MRCKHILVSSGKMCKKNAIDGSSFCTIHNGKHVGECSNDNRHEMDVSERNSSDTDTESETVSLPVPPLDVPIIPKTHIMKLSAAHMQPLPLKPQKYKKKDNETDEVSALVETLTTEIRKLNVRLDEVEITSKHKGGRQKFYTTLGLRQRALILHYNARKEDSAVINHVKTHIVGMGCTLNKVPASVIKMVTDSIFNNMSNDDMEFWFNKARDWFHDKGIVMKE